MLDHVRQPTRQIDPELDLDDLFLYAADALDGIQAIVRLVKDTFGDELDADKARVAIRYVALKLEEDISEIHDRLGNRGLTFAAGEPPQ